jgi:hypothetical protein
MDFATILADAKIIASLIELGLQVGENIEPFVGALKSVLSGQTLSDADRADMLANEARLRAILQTPLPADDGSTTT